LLNCKKEAIIRKSFKALCAMPFEGNAIQLAKEVIPKLSQKLHKGQAGCEILLSKHKLVRLVLNFVN
jgi:hypothetical protein